MTVIAKKKPKRSVSRRRTKALGRCSSSGRFGPISICFGRPKESRFLVHIRCLEIDQSFETTRKQAKVIKDRVKSSCLQYWSKSKSYDVWIEELVWKDCDIQRRLRGTGCEEKYEDAKEWLTEARLIDEAGCYCFINQACLCQPLFGIFILCTSSPEAI